MDQPDPVPTPPQAPLPQQPTVPSAPAPATAAKGLAITALILGIVAFLFGWLGLFSIFGAGNILTGIAAVIFGIIALVKRQPKSLALTGTILGGVGLLTTVVLIIVSTIGYASLSEKAKENAHNPANSSTSTGGTWDVDAAYDKVTNGMTKAQVEAATGKSSESCSESTTSYGKYETCNYGDYLDGGVLSVSYTDDKVSSKSKY